MTYVNALKKIYSYPRNSGVPSLERMRLLCHYLGDPQKKLKYIHIAGTNGKGSCAAMLDSVLREAGYCTGRYISPYILDFRERMTINGEMIPHDELALLAETVIKSIRQMENDIERAKSGESVPFQVVKPILDGVVSSSPVQFEVVTAIAFLYFYSHHCDAVVLECGLGGKYDATNIIDPPMVAVLMSIGLDHMELLGDTVEKIASEKCGIIKNGTSEVVSCPQYPEVRAVISAACVEASSRLTVPIRSDIKLVRASLGGLEFTYRGELYKTALAASYQLINASTVIEICDALVRVGMVIPHNAIVSGIEKTWFPARFEVLSVSPAIIVDGAHNAPGVTAFCDSLRNVSDSIEGKVTFIVGMLEDKSPEKALEPFALFLRSETLRTARVLTLTPDNPRAMKATELSLVISALTGDTVQTIPITAEGKELVKVLRDELSTLGRNDAVITFGSLYLASNLRLILRNLLDEK